MSERVPVRVIADRQVVLDPRRFETVDRDAMVVFADTDRPIDERDAEALRDLVARGGGLVISGRTLAAWSLSHAIRQLAGWLPEGRGPRTELVLRPDQDHPLTQRLPAEWKLTDALHLSEGLPADAAIVLRTSWRYTERVAAYERRFGDGRFVYLGVLDEMLLARALLFAARTSAASPVGVGLLGYGAIGRDHAASISATAGLRLAAICDVSPARRETASRDWSVRTHTRADELFADPDVDLVVVGTPPSAHTDPVLRALELGKHVVCEKPFALRASDGDRMIDMAASKRLVLTVYQSRRWDPDFIAMRDVARSGSIGDPFYLESFIGGRDHPCDFWHSHEPISGGTIYDWGSHYFDWILQLFGGTVRTVEAQAHKRVWHDVTNADQVRVDLTFGDGAQAGFLQSEIAFARKPKWYLLGTEGAVIGDWVEAAVPSDFPARVKVFRRSGEELLSLPPRDDNGFYRNLADHFAWQEPLAVSAEEARRTVAVMEAATQSIARGGAQLQVEL